MRTRNSRRQFGDEAPIASTGFLHGGYQHRFSYRGDWTLDSERRGSESDAQLLM
jgi:hypothetical protein